MVPVAARLLLREHARLLLRGRLEFGEADRASESASASSPLHSISTRCGATSAIGSGAVADARFEHLLQRPRRRALQHAKKMRAYARTQTTMSGRKPPTRTSSSTSRTGGSDAVQLCWPSHVCEDALPPSIDIVLPVGSVG